MLLKNLKLVKGSLLSLCEWPRRDIKDHSAGTCWAAVVSRPQLGTRGSQTHLTSCSLLSRGRPVSLPSMPPVWVGKAGAGEPLPQVFKGTKVLLTNTNIRGGAGNNLLGS